MDDVICNREGMIKLDNWLSIFEENKNVAMANKQLKNKDKQPLKSCACAIVIGQHGVGKTAIVNVVLNERKYNIIKLCLFIEIHSSLFSRYLFLI